MKIVLSSAGSSPQSTLENSPTNILFWGCAKCGGGMEDIA